MLKSLISAFTHTQNVSVQSRRRYETNFIREQQLYTFLVISAGIV